MPRLIVFPYIFIHFIPLKTRKKKKARLHQFSPLFFLLRLIYRAPYFRKRKLNQKVKVSFSQSYAHEQVDIKKSFCFYKGYNLLFFFFFRACHRYDQKLNKLSILRYSSTNYLFCIHTKDKKLCRFRLKVNKVKVKKKKRAREPSLEKNA